MSYKVTAIPEMMSREVRSAMVSPQYRSLDAVASLATGYGPCRSCLRVFAEGVDRRIYFTYNSFDGHSPLPGPGPVFIHENECERFEGPGFPPDLRGLPILLEAFGDGSRLISRLPIMPAEIDEQINSIFQDKEVRFINLRNAEAGCFVAAVERE